MSFTRLFCSRAALPSFNRSAAASSSRCRFFNSSSATRLDTQPQSNLTFSWDAVDATTSDIKRRIGRITQTALHETAEQKWQAKSLRAKAEFRDAENLNSIVNNPYAGRTVRVVDGNLAEAFRRLDTILGRNKVRRQLKLAERHEKKGVKRRRLESERWRRLFAHEVRKNVQLVTKIRKRGA